MRRIFSALIVLLLPGSTMAAPKTNPAAKTPVSALLAPWPGPHGGVPPFDKVVVSEFIPAIEQGMADTLKEVDAIANNAAKPTFENTIVALERSGAAFNRANSVYSTWSGSVSTPEFQAVEATLAPKFSEFQDKINQNTKLFARIKAVFESPAKAKLTTEQQRLTWLNFTNFELEGANLNVEQKKQLSEYNKSLAELHTKFSQNMLADEAKAALTIENKADLAGLPASVISGAAAEAEHRGLKGKWVFSNTRSSMEPFLTYSSNRALREKGFKVWVSRGDNNDAHDNNKIASDILVLRAKKAKLLGYPTFAHWHMANSMAKDPNAAMSLMLSVWKPAVEQFKADVVEVQAVADKEGAKLKIEPWDFRYYVEKLRKAKYDLDFNEVKPYLQLEHLREGMFAAAGALYGFTFSKVEGLPVINPDQTVYEVKGSKSEHVGYWYFDPYARTGKNSGAWMSGYRDQQKDKPATTIVSNNSNFVKGQPGEAVTVGWDDANTMFHEFGHALHGLSSNVTYASLSGTSTARDFVEFPSQFNEAYLTTPEVLKFLVNAKGEKIPEALLQRIEKAKRFNEGFTTAEAQASAIIDMKLHLLASEAPIDMRDFEKKTLAEIGMPPQMVMRHRIPGFGHIFSSSGYAAGYYSYIWSEVLVADTTEAFVEAGGLYDKATAKRYHDMVLSVGNSLDSSQAFRNFRGRDPNPDALLRAKGFPVPAR